MMFKSIYEKILALSIILMNLSSMFFVAPLSQTLSDLGNSLGQRAYLFLLACSASIYFFVYTYRLMKKIKYVNVYGKCCLLCSCLGIIIAVCIPFYPDDDPYLSAWHTNLAFMSAMTYILTMYHMIYAVMHKNYLFFVHALRSFTVLIAIHSTLFLYIGGVTTLLEISFTIAMVLFLPHLLAYEIK